MSPDLDNQPIEGQPTLFISHGAPTFALEPGAAGAALTRLGRQLSGVRAVVVVSPHWQTQGVRVSAAAAPATVHDFSGFDPALGRLRYPAPGDPALAAQIVRLLEAAGFSAVLDEQRGRDHGAWVPLMHLLPEATTPVLQVSMPHDLDARSAVQLGQALGPLRAQGVLVIGSGSLTHNLGEFRGPSVDAMPYVTEFVSWARQTLKSHDLEALIDYRRRAPHAVRAHPTDEHLLPLMVAAGAAAMDAPVEVIDGGVRYGMLSMESYLFGGLPAQALPA